MGGLSTRSGGRMRLGFRIRIPQVDERSHSMIEWKLANVRQHNFSGGVPKPVVIMTSYATHDIYQSIAMIMDNFGLEERGGIYTIDNGVQRRLVWDSVLGKLGDPAKGADGADLINPPGHYYFVRSLVVSGLMAKLKRQGHAFIYHSNMNNFGAILNDEYDALRGLFGKRIIEARTNHQPVPMTLVEIVANDFNRIGTYPVNHDSHFALLKDEMFPAEFDRSSLPYFNTGN